MLSVRESERQLQREGRGEAAQEEGEAESEDTTADSGLNMAQERERTAVFDFLGVDGGGATGSKELQVAVRELGVELEDGAAMASATAPMMSHLCSGKQEPARWPARKDP